jgi:HlyD family secretion protein
MRKGMKFSKSVISLVIIAAGGGAWFMFGQARPKQVEVLEVKAQAAEVALAFTGQIEAINESVISSQATASRVTALRVDLGARVKQGELLIELDSSTLRAQLTQARATLRAAEANLSKSRASLTGAAKTAALAGQSLQDPVDLIAARDQAKDNVRVLLERRRQAEAQYAKALRGGRDEEVRRADAAVTSAEAKTAERKKNWERMDSLLRQMAISKSDAEKARLEYDTAQAELESARANRDQIRTSSQEDLADSASNMAAASESHRAAERHARNLENSLRTRYSLRTQAASAEAELSVAREGVLAAEAEVLRARGSVEQFETQVSQMRLTSPIDGVVTRRSVNPGETVQPGAELLRVTGETQFRATADIDEKYVWQISPGQRVVIQPEAFSDLKITGRVDELAREADRDRGTVKVRFSLDRFDQRLRADLTLDINLTVASHRAALVVPDRFILRNDGGVYVMKIDEGTARRAAVKTDRQVDEGIIVTEGIKAGDLLCADPRSLTDGQKVRAQRT